MRFKAIDLGFSIVFRIRICCSHYSTKLVYDCIIITLHLQSTIKMGVHVPIPNTSFSVSDAKLNYGILMDMRQNIARLYLEVWSIRKVPRPSY